MAAATRSPPSTRYADDGTRRNKRSQFKGQYDESWAALIGIDNYDHYPRLKFAAADAVAMARVLIDYRKFPPNHVFLVVEPRSDHPLPPELASWVALNRKQLGEFGEVANKAAIEHLLYETLPSHAKPDDRVLIYFAGHGVPRVVDHDVRNAPPYLVPAPARRDHWREHIDVDEMLKEGNFLAAKHVLYVLDACCSGLADKRAGEDAKRYERKMLYLKARQCLTAGTREQRVDDSWEGKHSPFTGTLLRLLDGSHKTQPDEALCVSTVGAATKVAVAALRTATGQVPALFTTRGDRGGEFVFAALHAPISFAEQAALARTLVHDVGRCLDEPAPIEFAAKLWREILAATPEDQPAWLEALREHARTQLLLGHARAAIDTLDRPCLSGDPDAQLLRAIAWLHEDQRAQAAAAHDEAAAALERAAAALAALLVLHETRPHPYADWARSAIAVARQPRARRFALLIGVDRIPSLPGPPLQGCVHDVAAMAKLLRDKLGFTHVTSLVDADATIARIRDVFERLASDTRMQDSFVCYVSGPGSLRGGAPVYPSYDFDPASKRLLTEEQIHLAIRDMPAYDKLLIADGCYLAPAKNARPVGFRFVHAGRYDERSRETITPDGTARGAFTYALETAIRELGNVPIGRILGQVRAELASTRTPQTPGHSGSGSAMLLESRPPELEVIDLAELSHRSFAVERIETFAGRIEQAEQAAASRGEVVRMAPLWLAIGRARLSRGDLRGAITALTRADHPDARLPLVEAKLQAGQYGGAFDSWTTWRPAFQDTDDRGLIDELDGLLEAARFDTRRALLVTTDDAGGTRARDLAEQARLALLDRFAMLDSNITVLNDASRSEVLGTFRALTTIVQDSALFLFIGPGFDSSDVWLATREDGRTTSRLRACELRAIAAGARVSTALLITRSEAPAGSPPLAGPPLDHEQPEIGTATLVVAPHLHRDLEAPASGIDAGQLIEVLERKGHPTFTLTDWRSQIDGSQGSRLRGPATAAVLPYTAEHDRMLSLLRDIARSPLRPALAALHRLATQPENAADAWLQIAIVQAQCGRYAEGKAAADEALARRRADQLDGGDGTKRAGLAQFPEAHYHRGRILLALGKHTDAEAELRLAVEEQPDHARAHYYRERAIRALIGSDLEKLRVESIASYLHHGAPFGVDEEVPWSI
jgi:tetratricopeptide (TPR) repeat protein